MYFWYNLPWQLLLFLGQVSDLVSHEAWALLLMLTWCLIIIRCNILNYIMLWIGKKETSKLFWSKRPLLLLNINRSGFSLATPQSNTSGFDGWLRFAQGGRCGPYPNKVSYGAGVEKWKLEYETFTSSSKKKIEMSTTVSEYHLEVNPSDEDIHDCVVIQERIKSEAQFISWSHLNCHRTFTSRFLQ